MNLQPQDLLCFIALPVEHISSRENITNSWQYLLAEARSHFIYNEMLLENGLIEGTDGHILEVDYGSSKLNDNLLKRGLRTHTVHPEWMMGVLQAHQEYSLGVSHTTLEHLDGIQTIDFVVSAMARASRHGMIHQVHALDDPAFEWDGGHRTRMTGVEWSAFFERWAQEHQNEGWTYLGNHRGLSGRPKNHILERNGSLPFYKDYNKQIMRQVVNELTLANGISVARVPLLLSGFALARDNPYLLSGIIGGIHALDAVDGYAARKGFGNSTYGPFVDIAADHFAEILIAYQYAYELGAIPKSIPWTLMARNASVDFLRLYNGVTRSFEEDVHPHEAFGTTGTEGRIARGMYGAIKALGDMTIPIAPKLGLSISTVHVAASLQRAMPVWNSPRAKEISRELVERVRGNNTQD